jgi:hypothetical protein
MCYPHTTSLIKSQLLRLHPHLGIDFKLKKDQKLVLTALESPDFFNHALGEYSVDQVSITRSDQKSTYGYVLYDVTVSSEKGREIESMLSCNHVRKCAEEISLNLAQFLKDTVKHFHSLDEGNPDYARCLDIMRKISELRAEQPPHGEFIKSASELLLDAASMPKLNKKPSNCLEMTM